jgi:hypothetical protein
VPLLAVTVTVARPGDAVRSGLACSARRTSELDRDLCRSRCWWPRAIDGDASRSVTFAALSGDRERGHGNRSRHDATPTGSAAVAINPPRSVTYRTRRPSSVLDAAWASDERQACTQLMLPLIASAASRRRCPVIAARRHRAYSRTRRSCNNSSPRLRFPVREASQAHVSFALRLHEGHVLDIADHPVAPSSVMPSTLSR